MVEIDRSGRRLFRRVAGVAALLVVAACTNTPHRAPVEDRSPVPRAAVAAASAAAASAPVAPEAAKDPAVDTAAKPGYYTVKPGDTLIRIGLESGQNWKDLMRWNGLTNPNLIEVGQVLRVVAPGADPTAAVARPVTTARVETRPLDARPAAAPASAPVTTAGPTAPAPPAAAAPVLPPPVAAAPAAPRDADDDVSWGWPAGAPVAAPFDDARNKGLVFRGKAGDPVLAAADGRVVYAGSGLRGYGNLVILKHNTTYLTAYAHNQTLLVKDDQTVRKGQKIAEMGSTDADTVQLHFEIRRQGKPVDPARLLPPR
ncbi:MAG TPA: peptidoglycan DD-metalloendopeptidase family protein [Caldimonas sp.]|jgi:lipoprotein NlpD|nr:peptidoglycan DD-metalloendopeptidase family protein [Caldimonas sp.]HEX2541550.1 peptidoglycan DD-metalloendopeptidase family protein [Caldimonas sp.]